MDIFGFLKIITNALKAGNILFDREITKENPEEWNLILEWFFSMKKSRNSETWKLKSQENTVTYSIKICSIKHSHWIDAAPSEMY